MLVVLSLLFSGVGCFESSPANAPTNDDNINEETAADTAPPSKPTGLKTVATHEEWIEIEWDPSTDDVTPQDQIVYEVCVSDEDGGCDDFTVAGTTLPGTTSYKEEELISSTEYYFRVRAKDAAGNTSDPSDQYNDDTDGP